MKRISYLLVLPFFLLCILGGISLAEDKEEIMIGDHIFLGSIDQDGNTKNGKEPISWTVIDLDEKHCMLITDRIIEHSVFDNAANANTNWTNSTIRSWMNNDLFTDIFNETEQNLIIPDKTDESGKYINNYESTDRIFLLSKEEAEHYSLRNEARVIPSEQTDFTLEKDAYHREDWWLRTSYSVTEKHKEPTGIAAGRMEISSKLKEEYGVRPVIVVQKSEIEVRPFKLPERDEYSYLMQRYFDKTAPMQCMKKIIDKTTEYLSQHYDKAFRVKMKRSSHYIYYLLNVTTGETLIYDDKPSYFTPSSYTIIVENDTTRYNKKNGYEATDMGTAAYGFFD